MDIEKFKKMLTEHKHVMVEFEPSTDGNNPSTVNYELRDNGTILECYYGIDRGYPVCNINNEREMADEFLLMRATKMTPSSPRIVQRYNA